MKLLSHPLFQACSFLIIIVGSDHFAAPYIIFLYNALKEFYLYAIIGTTAVIITLASLLAHSKKAMIQLVGLSLMILSLAVFFFRGDFNNAYSFNDLIPLLTLLVFFIVVFAVTNSYFINRKTS
jgi:hypothetical protein